MLPFSSVVSEFPNQLSFDANDKSLEFDPPIPINGALILLLGVNECIGWKLILTSYACGITFIPESLSLSALFSQA